MIKKRSGRAALLACAGVASLGLVVGATPAAAKTKRVTATFNQCQNLAAHLDDKHAVQIPFAVPRTPKKAKPVGGRVLAVNSVGLRITHSFTGDISAYLISPSGRVDPLTLNRGDDGDDYGSGATNCGGTLTTFSDSGGTAIGDGTAPFAGGFRPEAPLSVFVGGVASGIWTVLIADNASGDTGTIHAASLNLTYRYKKPIKKKK